MMKIG